MFTDPKQAQSTSGVKIHSAGDVARFLLSLGLRESFALELRPDFPQGGWAGGGNIVWYEGIVAQGQEEFQFFYDDGVEPRFDEDDEEIGDTNDYPSIVCKAADIVSMERLGGD